MIDCLCNAWGREGIVVHHEEYLRLGENVEDRLNAYRELFRYSLSSEDVHIIEDASRYNRPVGDSRFCEQIADRYGVQFPRQGRGRHVQKRLVNNNRYVPFFSLWQASSVLSHWIPAKNVPG